MNTRSTFNLGALICLVAVVYLIYYLLLMDHLLPLSISSVFSGFNHRIHHWHVLAVGLLPVYLALMIFGTSIIGIYLGGALQRWISQFLQNK